jgi:hypothetical protein
MLGVAALALVQIGLVISSVRHGKPQPDTAQTQPAPVPVK